MQGNNNDDNDHNKDSSNNNSIIINNRMSKKNYWLLLRLILIVIVVVSAAYKNWITIRSMVLLSSSSSIAEYYNTFDNATNNNISSVVFESSLSKLGSNNNNNILSDNNYNNNTINKITMIRGTKANITTTTNKKIRTTINNNATTIQTKARTNITTTTTISTKIRNNTNLIHEPQYMYSNFLSHIPKSGATSALKMIMQLLNHKRSNRYWKKIVLPNNEKKFRVCEGTPRRRKQTFKEHIKGVRCAMWMIELPAERYKRDRYKNIYTIVRNPITHAISQYFHCKESEPHKKYAYKMPNTLQDWLDAWVNVMDENNTTEIQKLDRKFFCYNPINFQSKWMNFNSSVNTNTTNNASSPTTPLLVSDNSERQAKKEDLRKRFKVIGITNEMHKSVCLIFIRFTGWVPEQCDCSASSISPLSSKKEQKSHGVKHHGDTFNRTMRHEEAIAKLRADDILLYNISLEIFQEQVKEVENEYNVQLCG